ncbi:MAG: L-threonylcarbamoyladenylate synthase [Minisyncoccia bacterium]
MEIFIVDSANLEREVDRAVSLLRAGEVIVIPTDTVYGLAADARNETAIVKVFELKQRASEKALPIFVSSFEMLKDVAVITDDRVRTFLARVWPGAVTAVLVAREGLPHALNGGSPTIAVRIPDNIFIQSIIEKLGGPITGTSANVSEHATGLTAGEVANEFSRQPLQPAAIFDSGPSPCGPSTIADCTMWPPKVLRVGAISAQDIELITKEINANKN